MRKVLKAAAGELLCRIHTDFAHRHGSGAQRASLAGYRKSRPSFGIDSWLGLGKAIEPKASFAEVGYEDATKQQGHTRKERSGSGSSFRHQDD